jgi:hypothetical protein
MGLMAFRSTGQLGYYSADVDGLRNEMCGYALRVILRPVPAVLHAPERAIGIAEADSVDRDQPSAQTMSGKDRLIEGAAQMSGLC